MFALLTELFSNGFLFFALHLQPSGSFPSPLPAKEEQRFLAEMKNGSANARSKLIEHNLRLVAHIVKKYYPTYAEQDDLISIGTIGLIKGIDTFQPERNIRLATYASRCIENEILMYFRAQKKTNQEVSMDDPIEKDSEGNPLTLMDVIPVEDTIADDIDMQMKTGKIQGFVNRLKDKRERDIIIMRYGLNGKEPLTQKEAAEKLGISRSYVSRIEKKALAQLRRFFGD